MREMFGETELQKKTFTAALCYLQDFIPSNIMADPVHLSFLRTH